MFKERLKVACREGLYCLMQAVVFIVVIGLLIGLIVLVSEVPIIETIVGYIVYMIVGLFLLVLAGAIVVNVCVFINWLFIEPYKARKN